MTSKKGNNKVVMGLILGIIPLLFLIYIVVGPLLHTIGRDLTAKEMYVISEWVNVRAAPDAKSLKMGKIFFGTKLLCYGENNGWSEVLIENHQGYVASKFIVDKKSFQYLDGLFADKQSSKKVTSTKYRMALVRYFISKGYTTEMPEDIKKKSDNDTNASEVYQLYTEAAGSKYNTVVFADFDGDFRNDVAFVITNKIKDINRLVILSLDKDNPYNLSKILYDKELEHSWQYIRLAKKGRHYLKNDEKFKLPLSGLLIGSNRNKNLDDDEYLFLYNGEGFDMFKQNKENPE